MVSLMQFDIESLLKKTFLLLLGVLGAAALTAGGVVAGTTQIVRGVVNTPEALSQGNNMKWDRELGKWVDDSVNLAELSFSKLEDSDSEDEEEAEKAK